MRRFACFDLDGTLVRLPVDIDGIRQHFRAVARKDGFVSDFRPILPELERYFDALRATAARQAEARVRALRQAFADMEAENCRAVRLACPVVEALKDLCSMTDLVLFTNNGRPVTEQVLDKQCLLFSAIYCRDDLDAWSRVKPHPALFQRFIAEQGRPESICYLGDSDVDGRFFENAVQLLDAGGRAASRLFLLQGSEGVSKNACRVENVPVACNAMEDFLREQEHERAL